MDTWQASPRLADFLTKLFDRHLPSGLGSDILPSVMWSLGGTMQERGSEDDVRTIPARYTVGWIKSADIGRFAASFEHPKYGNEVFRPSETDSGSPKKLLDFMDGEIVVVQD